MPWPVRLLDARWTQRRIWLATTGRRGRDEVAQVRPGRAKVALLFCNLFRVNHDVTS